MKKFKKVLIVTFSFLILLGVSLGLASCGDGSKDLKKIYLITDGSIDDKAFNEGCWKAIEAFIKSKDKEETKYKQILY